MNRRIGIWKKGILIGCIAALVTGLTGCGMFGFGYGSNYAQQTERTSMTLDPSVLTEIDLADFYSEENGYSFYNASWYVSPEETEEQLGYSLGKANVLEKGIIVYYTPEEAAGLLLGKVCSRVELTYNYEGLLHGVTYEFTAGDAMTSEELDVFIEDVAEAIAELYGEGEKKQVYSDTVQGKMKSTLYKWDKKLENTDPPIVTSLQVASSSLSGNTDVVLVGLLCYIEETEETTEK